MLAQTPKAGSNAPKDSEVKLVVAKAPPDVAVPDVVGERRRRARATRCTPPASRSPTAHRAGHGPDAGRRRDRADAGRRAERAEGVEGEDRHRQALDQPDAHTEPRADSVRVAVLYGGRSSEHEVSLASAESVREGVAAAGHEVVPILIERGGAWTLDGEPLSLRPGEGLVGADAAFPVLHGPFGEDGTVQGVLELLDVPYVGAGVLASSLCMDKVVFKEVMHAAGVPQVRSVGGARGALARGPGRGARASSRRLGTPLFVKPARLGSSVGIAKVWAEAEVDGALDGAFAHDSLVIVEAFSDGLEVECSVIGLDDPEVSVPGEIVLAGAEWYDYEAKYTAGGMELRVPARIPDAVAEEVRGLAREAFLRVGCAGLARVDFFVEGDRVLVNELNTMPGFTVTSVFPKLWEASGLPFPALCDRLLGFALERFGRERAGHAF